MLKIDSDDRYEAALDPWMSSLWSILNKINPKFFPQGPYLAISDMKLIDQPKVQITYHGDDNVDSQFPTNPGNVDRFLLMVNAQ